MKHGGSGLDVASRLLGAATIVALLGTLASAFVLGSAQAQGATPAATLPSPVFGMMQGLVGLVVVLGVIFGAGWLLKKFGTRTPTAGAVQVVGGASVGPREKVVVVRFGGQTLLLGVAPGQVSLLQTMPTPEAVDDAASDGPPRFADRLRAARGGA